MTYMPVTQLKRLSEILLTNKGSTSNNARNVKGKTALSLKKAKEATSKGMSSSNSTTLSHKASKANNNVIKTSTPLSHQNKKKSTCIIVSFMSRFVNFNEQGAPHSKKSRTTFWACCWVILLLPIIIWMDAKVSTHCCTSILSRNRSCIKLQKVRDFMSV